MGRKKTTGEKIRDAIKGKVGLVVEPNGNGIFCQLCATTLDFEERTVSTRVKDHVATKFHQKKLKEREDGDKSVQPQALAVMETQKELNEKSDFNRRLTQACMAADIPLHKLANPVLKEFLEKETKRQISHPNTLRNYVSPLVEEKMEWIRNQVKGKAVYLIVDETTDPKSRFCVNVMIGTLDGQPSKPMLLDVCFTEKNDNESIQQVIHRACNIIWPDVNVYPLLHLILSDQASYMLKAVKKLKETSFIYPNLKHITCIAHALSRVADKVSDDHELVNKYLVELKRFLCKSNKRCMKFKEVTKLPLPPVPVKTRWGTWLQAVDYHIENYDIVKDFILNYKLGKESDSAAFCRLKHMLLTDSEELEKEFMNVRKYTSLSAIITSLEKEGASLNEQLSLLQTAESLVKGSPYESKLKSCLDKNPDLETFAKNIESLTAKVQREYMPLTSVGVERSFSRFKAMLRDNRLRLTTEHIREYMILNYNQ